MLVLGSYRKDGKYSKDKENIGNRKVNRGGPHSQPTYTVCVENTPGRTIQHIPLGIYHAGGFNAMT